MPVPSRSARFTGKMGAAPVPLDREDWLSLKDCHVAVLSEPWTCLDTNESTAAKAAWEDVLEPEPDDADGRWGPAMVAVEL